MSIRLTDNNINKHSAKYWCIASDKILLEELDKLNKKTSDAIKDKKFQKMVVNKLKTTPGIQKDGMVNEGALDMLTGAAKLLLKIGSWIGSNIFLNKDSDKKSTSNGGKQQPERRESFSFPYKGPLSTRKVKIAQSMSKDEFLDIYRKYATSYAHGAGYEKCREELRNMDQDKVDLIRSVFYHLDDKNSTPVSRDFMEYKVGKAQIKNPELRAKVQDAKHKVFKQDLDDECDIVSKQFDELQKVKLDTSANNKGISNNNIEKLPPKEANKPNYALYIGVAAAAAIGIPYLWKRAKLLTDYIKSGKCIAKCVFTADDQEYVFQFDIKTNEWKLKYNDVKVLKYTPYPEKETIASFVRTEFAKNFVKQCKAYFEKLYSVTDYKLLIDALKISNKSKDYACIDYLFENQKMIENNLYAMKYKKEW